MSVSIRPTEVATKFGRPALTPELLAASGARYSRNNEGLESILSKIDPDNLDGSVDSIFKMIDYGHQSIADMAPVAIFIDDISILLAYLVWSWCPTAGGQESSTRYIKLAPSGLVEPSLLGVPEAETDDWYQFMSNCFNSYEASLTYWTDVGAQHPDLARIPESLRNDGSERAKKQVERMMRNFAFDRARYFLPVAAKTNVMLLMSARGWSQLCQIALSHWLPEAQLLGEKIRDELKISAPRLVKHATSKSSYIDGHRAELLHWAKKASEAAAGIGTSPCESQIVINLPHDVEEADLVDALEYHDNRYAFTGSAACRTSVRFGWSAVAIAEIRDLNRHRTGSKYCPLVPVGFYCAEEQLPTNPGLPPNFLDIGNRATCEIKSRLQQQSPSFAAWILLGTQFKFEHTTTLDKFIYEAELRTGVGAHFRYANHLRDAVGGLKSRYPRLFESIKLGTNEPE
jgi:thymidylate synthase ThyX